MKKLLIQFIDWLIFILKGFSLKLRKDKTPPLKLDGLILKTPQLSQRIGDVTYNQYSNEKEWIRDGRK